MKRIILLVYLLSLFSATRVTAQDEPKPKPEKKVKMDAINAVIGMIKKDINYGI